MHKPEHSAHKLLWEIDISEMDGWSVREFIDYFYELKFKLREKNTGIKYIDTDGTRLRIMSTIDSV